MTHDRSPRLGLFAKLMIAFLVVIISGAFLTTWLIRGATEAEFELYTTSIGLGQAERISSILADYYVDNGGWEGINSYLATSVNFPSGPRTGQGNPMMGNRRGQGPMSGNEMMSGMNVWQIIGLQLLLVDASGRIVADPSGDLQGLQLSEDDLNDGVPVSANGQHVGTILVTTAVESPTQNQEFLQKVDRAILISVVIAGGIAILFGALIVWRIVRPVRQLTSAAQAIASGELDQKVEVPPGDEIGDLAMAFNQMSTRLSRSEALRRQMTADIAHELRTPLTVIQGNVEALQDGIFPLTVDALDPIYDTTRLLSRLVEDLRQLTLAETGQLALDRQPINLSELAHYVVDAFRAPADLKSVSINLEDDNDLPLVYADAQRIEQVLTNYLSNALRYTPGGGRIIVTVGKKGGKVQLAVHDSGPGLPEEVLSNVFERFYRVDRGRGRDSDGSGSGLGLAVARSIIKAHDGEVGVESLPGAGATFWFRLPAV